MTDREDDDEPSSPPGNGSGRDEDIEDGDSGSTAGVQASTVDRDGDAEAQRGDDASGSVAEPSAGAVDAREILEDEALGESRRLDGTVRYHWLVGSTVAAAITAVVVTGFFQATAGRIGIDPWGSLPLGASQTTLIVLVLAFLAFEGLAAVRAVLLYRSWRYEVREDSLYLSRGVLTRVQTVAPYVRVQHIDTRRSPTERVLGLSSLVVYTAGSRGADVTVPGLTDERAAELQRRLKRLTIASEEEDAV